MDDQKRAGEGTTSPSKEVMKLTAEQARADFEKQLDFLNITPLERTNNDDVIDVMVEAIQMGRISIKDDHSVVQKLLHPIGKEVTIDKLTFKPRIQDRDLTIHLKGVKATDVDGRLRAHVAAGTGVSKGVLSHLDRADSKITHAYITFFI